MENQTLLTPVSCSHEAAKFGPKGQWQLWLTAMAIFMEIGPLYCAVALTERFQYFHIHPGILAAKC